MCIYNLGRIYGDSYHYANFGVRPIICLTTGVQLEETGENTGIYNVK